MWLYCCRCYTGRIKALARGWLLKCQRYLRWCWEFLSRWDMPWTWRNSRLPLASADGGTPHRIAFAVTFLLVIILMHLLGKLLTKLIDMVSLGLFNKLFGIVMGVLKAAIVVSVVLFIVNALDVRYDFISAKTKSDSLLYKPFVNFANGVYENTIK